MVLGALIAIGCAGSASGSEPLPVSPTFLGGTFANGGLQVKPLTVTYTGDGTGFLGGAHARSQSDGIRWTKWTAHLALGTGFNQLNNCKPYCAAGKFHGYRVKIEMWRPRRRNGILLFTRLTIFYKHSRPRGEPRHYTFTDVRMRGTGGFGWAPPSARGYCTHTYGLKPSATCKHIHSLPR